MLTARFDDGDSANNRGGSQHVEVRQRGQRTTRCSGATSRAWSTSSTTSRRSASPRIWITPVVLNRSDYDYHGYHGWDFYRVDPRLESPGASYQDLINAAHAKGMKIYQDVVYNHSSRWGAKGLFTPTVYGVRDDQWSGTTTRRPAGSTTRWSSTRTASLTPAQNAGQGRPYNGDLWSTAEPAGNTCLQLGHADRRHSPEGYTLYNCQWPSPTCGMFPAILPPVLDRQLGGRGLPQLLAARGPGRLQHRERRRAAIPDRRVQPVHRHGRGRLPDRHRRAHPAGHLEPALPARASSSTRSAKFGATRAKDFYVFGEVAAFVNDKWNRGSVNHSAQFFTWKERKEYSADDVTRRHRAVRLREQLLGTGGQPTSNNAFLQRQQLPRAGPQRSSPA